MALRTWQLAFVLALFGASGARLAAQAPRVVLNAQLPDALRRCVSSEQLQASLARELRRHQQQVLELRVELHVASVEGGVTQLELAAATPQRALGTRVLPVRAADCSALPDTLALVLLLLSQAAEPVPPPPSAAEPAFDAELPPGQRPAPPAPKPRRALDLGLGLGGARRLAAGGAAAAADGGAARAGLCLARARSDALAADRDHRRRQRDDELL